MDTIEALRARGLPPALDTWLATCESLAEAWRTCESGEWLIHIASALDLERTLLVQASADVVAEALAEHRMRAGAPRAALIVTLQWIEGTADSATAWATGFSAMDVARTLRKPSVRPDTSSETDARATHEQANAAEAAALLAFACDDRADAMFYRHRGYAPSAVRTATRTLPEAGLAANRVRARIPLSDVLSAARRAEPSQVEAPLAEQSGSFYV